MNQTGVCGTGSPRSARMSALDKGPLTDAASGLVTAPP
jgi:hypothetical protein